MSRSLTSWLLGLLGLCIARPGVSQSRLTGQVTDSTGAAVSMATVLVRATPDGPVLAFATADEAGAFRLTFKQLPTCIITATALGYEPASFSYTPADSLPDQIRFVLAAAAITLRESVVRAKIPVLIRPDTITFRADAFRDSTERTLEALLEKLPGVEVNRADGSIKVQGQPIRRILIEGDDLTGRNYQLLSQSLAADLVDKIQVISRYEANKQLKGIRQTEDKVLNITIKDSRKSRFFGTILTGIGNKGRTQNTVNAFTFGKKIKVLSVGSFNTIGQQPVADQSLQSDNQDTPDPTPTEVLLTTRTQSVLGLANGGAANVGNQPVRFNKSGMGATQFMWRPSTKSRVSGAVAFLSDTFNSFRESQIAYRTPDSAFVIREQISRRQQLRRLDGQLRVEADLDTNTTLIFRLLSRQTVLQNTVGSLLNTQNSINNEATGEARLVTPDLMLTRRFSARSALNLHLNATHETRSDKLDFQQSIARTLPLVAVLLDAGQQTLTYGTSWLSASGQYYRSLNGWQTTLSTGFTKRSDDLATCLSGRLREKAVILPNLFANRFQLAQTTAYAGVELTGKSQAIRWLVALSGGWLTARQHVSDSVPQPILGRWYALPMFGLRWEQGQRLLAFTYTRTNTLPTLWDVNRGLILTDYRSLNRGSAVYLPTNSHLLSGNWAGGNLAGNWAYFLNGFYSVEQQGYQDVFTLTRDFGVAERQPNQFNRQASMLTGSLERYWPGLAIRLKLRPSGQHTIYQNSINDQQTRTVRATQYTLNLSVRSGFMGWFNFYTGSVFSVTQVNSTAGGNQQDWQNKPQTLSGFVDCTLRLAKELTINVDNEAFRFWQPGTDTQAYLFLNARLDYRPTRNRLSFTLRGQNLTDTRQVINRSVTDYAINLTQTRLLPRYVLAQVNWQFQ